MPHFYSPATTGPWGKCEVARSLSEHHCGLAGSLGAARNLEGLQKRGVTHVLNASPIVPCFHRRHFRYKCVPVYDDVDEDISSFFTETNRFIAKVCLYTGCDW